MRKTIVIVLVLAIALWSGAALNKNTHSGAIVGDEAGSTIQTGFVLVNTVTADDTALTTSTKYWDSIDGVFIPIRKGWSIVELSVYGYGDGDGVGSPANATFTLDIDACRWDGGAKDVATIAGTIGAQQMSVVPHTGAQTRSGAADPNYCWADTGAFSGNGEEWIGDVQLSGEGGNDGILTISFDGSGYAGVWVAITDMTGQSVTSVTVVMSGYD